MIDGIAVGRQLATPDAFITSNYHCQLNMDRFTPTVRAGKLNDTAIRWLN